ncbi:MAG: glycoside hydrolase family 15 protein, partial [Candidatus Saccharimonadales bacterium]
WEEVYLTTTYTTAVTYAALLAAAELAEAAEDADSAVKWRSAADDIAAAAHHHLYNPNRQSFYKGVIVRDGQIEYNDTIDNSSVFGVFMFGLFPVGSDELQAAVATIQRTFGLSDSVIGLPRYENDDYCRVDGAVNGNWWLITTLWLAQYYLEIDDHPQAERIIDWVKNQALSTGIMPEQISPIDGSAVSVAPLTWSHAEYIATLLDTITEKK